MLYPNESPKEDSSPDSSPDNNDQNSGPYSYVYVHDTDDIEDAEYEIVDEPPQHDNTEPQVPPLENPPSSSPLKKIIAVWVIAALVMVLLKEESCTKQEKQQQKETQEIPAFIDKEIKVYNSWTTVPFTTERLKQGSQKIWSINIHYTVQYNPKEPWIKRNTWNDGTGNSFNQLWYFIDEIEGWLANTSVLVTYLFLHDTNDLARAYRKVLDQLDQLPWLSYPLTDHHKAWYLTEYFKSYYSWWQWEKSSSQFFPRSNLDHLEEVIQATINSTDVLIDDTLFQVHFPDANYKVALPLSRKHHYLWQWHHETYHPVNKLASAKRHSYYTTQSTKGLDQYVEKNDVVSSVLKFGMVEFVHNSKDVLTINEDIQEALREYFTDDDNWSQTISFLKEYVNNVDKLSDVEITERLIEGMVNICHYTPIANLSHDVWPDNKITQPITYYMFKPHQWDHVFSYLSLNNNLQIFFGSTDSTIMPLWPVQLTTIPTANQRFLKNAKKGYLSLQSKFSLQDPKAEWLPIVLHYVEEKFSSSDEFLRQSPAILKKNMQDVLHMLTKPQKKPVNWNAKYKKYYSNSWLTPLTPDALKTTLFTPPSPPPQESITVEEVLVETTETKKIYEIIYEKILSWFPELSRNK